MPASVREQFYQALNHLLLEGDDADKCYAARTAGQVGALSSVQPLLECLYHEDADVCIDAADALALLKQPETIARLIEVVEMHPEGDAKVSAANALGQLDNTTARTALLTWAKGNPSQDNANFAADWDDWWDIQLNAIKALGLQGCKEAVPVLIEVLAEEPLDIESDILRALIFSGEEGLQHVIALTQGTHLRLARRAANALRHATCEPSLIALFKALHHEDGDVRGTAAEALGQRQAKQYFIDLIQLLRDPLPQVRQQALTAAEMMLNQLQSHHLKYFSEATLTPLLDTLDAEGRALILNALARLLDNQHQPSEALYAAIDEGISSSHPTEIEAAATLLIKFPKEGAELLLFQRLQDDTLPLGCRRNLVMALQSIGLNHRDYLIPLNALLQEDGAALRQVVMETIGALSLKPAQHDGIAAAELLELYLAAQTVTADDLQEKHDADADADDENRIPCVLVNADGEQDTQQPVTDDSKMAAILARFSDAVYPNEDAQSQIVKAAPQSTLDAINQSNIQAALQSSNSIEDDGLGEHIRDMVDELPEELDDFGNIVVGHLDNGQKLKLNRKKIARMPDFSNQLFAIKALGKVSNDNNVERLLRLLLETDQALLEEAVCSLGLIAESNPKLETLSQAIGPLSTMLLGGTDQIRQLSARALGFIGHRTALPILKEALHDNDSNVRIETIRALARFSTSTPTSVLEAIKACLQDPVDGVVLAAFEFLSDKPATDVVDQIVQLGLQNSALTATAAKTVAQIAPEAAAQQLLEPILGEGFASQRPKALQMLTILASHID